MPVHLRTSHVLQQLIRENGKDTVSVREIVDALGNRGFALLVALLGLPNCIPMVPPIPLLCGLLLFFVAVQMALGARAPWMPHALLDRTMKRDDLASAVAKAMPWVERLERFSQPRFAILEHHLAVRIIGVILIVLALGLLVAAPIVGQIPLGLAVCLIGLGLVERDGVVVLAGLIVGAAGVALSLGFVWALIFSFDKLF